MLLRAGDQPFDLVEIDLALAAFVVCPDFLQLDHVESQPFQDGNIGQQLLHWQRWLAVDMYTERENDGGLPSLHLARTTEHRHRSTCGRQRVELASGNSVHIPISYIGSTGIGYVCSHAIAATVMSFP